MIKVQRMKKNIDPRNAIMLNTSHIRVRFAQGDHIVFCGNTTEQGNGRVISHSFLDNVVEIRQRVELVHGWIICIKRKKLVSKFGLDVFVFA